MAVNFLHGVETIEIASGARKINVVKSAVIGLVGIAPIGTAQQLILVNNEKDAAQFGKEVPGFNIPKALAAIFAQGAGTVIVINVFDSTTNTVSVSNETKVLDANGKAKFAYPPLSNIVVTNTAGTTTYVLNTDYKVDEFGNMQVLNFTSIAPGASVKASYKRLDPTTVTASQLIGSIDGTTNVRTGTKLFDLARQQFGFKAKIFIAPFYSNILAVSQNLISLANKFKGICYIDAPVGTTVPGAIAGRGPLGTINFNTSDERAELLFPNLKAYDVASDSNAIVPYSMYLAGLRAAVDNNEGYWVSSSNHEIKGIVSAEIPISAEINDASTEANALNEVGITTVFNSFGSGLSAWGNRNASFPASSDVKTFVVIRRIADVVHESIELGMLQFMDQPITPALLDAVRESVNSFIRTLIGRGALTEGSKCVYIPANNPPEELAAGHVTWDLIFMGPTPLERATFQSFIDINLLSPAA